MEGSSKSICVRRFSSFVLSLFRSSSPFPLKTPDTQANAGHQRQQTIYLERFDFGSMVKWFNQLFDEEIAYQPISQPSESANHPLALKRVLCPAVANQQCFYNQWISRAISFVYSLLFALKSTLAKDVHAVFHKWYCWLPKYFPYYLSSW